jgi:hypothetical protein
MSAHNPKKRKKKLKKSRRSARRSPPRRRPKNLRAPHKRATRPQFVQLFSLASLSTLPLPLDISLELPPFPRQRFRSRYRPCSRRRIRRLFGWLKAHQPRRSSWFEIALHLVDFEPIRPLLLYLTQDPSARGETPFDPLSLMLASLWKIHHNLSWTTVASELAHPQNGALWRKLCGFADQDTPAESTLRAFRDDVPDCLLNDVLGLFLEALHRVGLLPPVEDTHGYIIVGDGQLHAARSRHRCHYATAACYLPTSIEQPRPCPAREESEGRYSCACDQPTCEQRCGLAPRLDPQARYIIYSRQEKKQGQQTIIHIDKAVFGYRSMAGRLVDQRFCHAWNVHTDLFPATADEGVHFPTHFQAVYASLPLKEVGDVLYDSACGEQPCLDAVYDVGGIPLFDIQRDPSDRDEKQWLKRGYDDHGRPLCHQGFTMTYQGIDYSRPRARWVCGHICRQSEQGEVPGCEYLNKPSGQRVYIQRHLPGGNYRLARLVPHGSKSWKRRTRWRNTSESRNSSLQNKGLLRLPDYGHSHGIFLIIGADVVENLCTLARLVYQATLDDDRFRALQQSKTRQRFLIRATPTASAEGEISLAVEVLEIS